MEPGSPHQAIRSVEKYTRALERHVITPEEFAPQIVRLFEVETPTDASLADEICRRIPEEARSLVLKCAQEILSPDYRFNLHIGGPGPTPEVREALRAKYEANIRAWAKLLVTTLGGNKEDQ